MPHGMTRIATNNPTSTIRYDENGSDEGTTSRGPEHNSDDYDADDDAVDNGGGDDDIA